MLLVEEVAFMHPRAITLVLGHLLTLLCYQTGLLRHAITLMMRSCN